MARYLVDLAEVARVSSIGRRISSVAQADLTAGLVVPSDDPQFARGVGRDPPGARHRRRSGSPAHRRAAAPDDSTHSLPAVALMGEDLTHLPTVILHAQQAGRIMRQNLALSALILLTLVPLAALGVLGLATVVAAHELAEVLVIANGVRAGRRPRPAFAGTTVTTPPTAASLPRNPEVGRPGPTEALHVTRIDAGS